MEQELADLVSAVSRLERKVRREREARLTAETVLEGKSRELFEANQSLIKLNQTLEHRIQERTKALDEERRRAIHLAESDYLTGLANRLCFSRRLKKLVKEAKAEETHFALLLLDLDGFKKLNDTYGHAAGDATLKIVADRLYSSLRENDLAARLGGDEFAVLLVGDDSAERVEGFCKKLQDIMALPFKIGAHFLECFTSIGYALCPQDSCDFDEIQVCADLALYQAKDAGKGCSIAFEQHMAAAYRLRVAIGGELERDLAKGAISVHLQPIVSLQADRANGCEALLRWCHEEHGPISPLDTLTAAAERGLHGELTCRIIERSLKTVASALREGTLDWISINLAERDLSDSHLPEFVMNMVAELGIDPRKVRFEVTESAIISDPVAARELMLELNAHGIEFLLDDFGTGYSNLQILNQLPFKALKIDKSFVADIATSTDKLTMVRAMIDLAHALRLYVVAEGVETETQRRLLKSLSCDYLQGFLPGRPSETVPLTVPDVSPVRMISRKFTAEKSVISQK
ncbi:putative bifunctional diguanylate cyclase/phosphodiesterase [Roseibium sediminis]|uniref:putative bifunctional diguanylate cyclase/phosphodiesterase n=1 Tax=Roseibium sediminis TaxID=1775174 RepID=UPI00123C7E24|nr:EAL domain-containing protein [Roseibium sediminis]